MQVKFTRSFFSRNSCNCQMNCNCNREEEGSHWQRSQESQDNATDDEQTEVSAREFKELQGDLQRS
jgi:hypothetical protein